MSSSDLRHFLLRRSWYVSVPSSNENCWHDAPQAKTKRREQWGCLDMAVMGQLIMAAFYGAAAYIQYVKQLDQSAYASQFHPPYVGQPPFSDRLYWGPPLWATKR